MQISLYQLWIPIVVTVLIALYIVIQQQFRFNDDRTIDEVTVFLRKVDWDEAQELFDLMRERYMRLIQSDYHFRRTTRVHIHQAREFFWRMYHNVRVVHEWANTELQDIEKGLGDDCPERERLVIAVAQRAAHFRALATVRLVQLTAWTVFRIERWPFTRIPSIAAMRKYGEQGELDLLELYSQLKEAAADLALTYGKNFHDEMLDVLLN